MFFNAQQILAQYQQWISMQVRTPLVEQAEVEPDLEEGDDNTFPTQGRYPQKRRNRKGGRTVAQKI